MKIIIIFLTFLSLAFSSSVYANEVKCKIYDVVCKSKNFVTDTKEYQKKEFEEAAKKKKSP